MPTRKIKDFQSQSTRYCNHPEHNPPPMQVFSPGTYEHICPACHRRRIFVVPPKPQLRVSDLSIVPTIKVYK